MCIRDSHTPTQLPNNLEYTISTAQAAKKLGFKFLLNYHYSDTWADPGKQFLPKAWELSLIHISGPESLLQVTVGAGPLGAGVGAAGPRPRTALGGFPYPVHPLK